MAQTLLLTRPARQAEAFAARLEQAMPGRWVPLIAPLMEIRPMGTGLDLSGFDRLILTSVNAVECLAEVTDQRLPANCVGPRTAKRAADLGFPTILEAGTAEELITELLKKSADPFKTMHVRGRHTTTSIAKRLRQAGWVAEEHVAYDQVPVALNEAACTALRDGQIDAAAVFSPRSARLLQQEMPLDSDLAKTALVAISDAAAIPLKASGFVALHVAAEPNAAGMMAALAKINPQK